MLYYSKLICDEPFPMSISAARLLLGGLPPASKRAIAGAEDAEGTWGKLSDKANIKKALRSAFSMMAMVHAPLLGMTGGAAGDFGDAFGLFFGVVRFFFGLSPLRGCSTAYPLYRRVSFSAGGLLYPPVDWRRIASSGSTHVVVPLRRW